MAEKKKNLIQKYRSWKGRPRLASRFGTWRKKQGERKNRNQLKRYSRIFKRLLYFLDLFLNCLIKPLCYYV